MLVETHLLLVHQAPVHNITPALDPSFRPSKVFLLSSPETRDETDRLAHLLRDTGLKVNEWPVADPWDMEHVRERVLAFLAERPEEGVALNASGGTLPMSLAAYEVFRYADRPVYYVHPENDHVVWLHPKEQQSFDLADRIRLPAFLAAHDLRLVSIVRQGIHENLRALTATLVGQVERFASPLAVLNWHAAATSKRGNLTSPPLKTEQLQRPELAELIELFSAHGLFAVDPQQRLVFSSEAALSYVKGGWLEEHVFGVLSSLRREMPIIQDLGRNMIVEWSQEGSPVTNEIDVVFLANNRLHLIECKAKKFDQDQSADSEVVSTLYKLDTLRNHLGGEGARAMLVSYRGVGNSVSYRAAEIDIELCKREELTSLTSRIKSMIDI